MNNDIDELAPGLRQARSIVARLKKEEYKQSEATFGRRVQKHSEMNPLAGTMILASPIPVGNSMVKMVSGELLLPPEGFYFTWELHEGLTRQTVLMVVGLVVMIATSAVYPDMVYHSVYRQLLAGQMEW
jgi:hypothetical protein